MIYLLPPIITILWLIGGQISKGARRYGVPGATLALLFIQLLKTNKKEMKQCLKYLIFLLLIPALTVGYGINSHLMKWLKREWLVRVAYATMLSVPLLVYALVAGQVWKYPVILALLIGAFQVRADKLGTIGDSFDILVEDIVRSLTLGGAIVWLVA